MQNDANAILDDLLSRWHEWAQGYRPGRQAACPMFQRARSPRGWEDSSDITAHEVDASTMKAVDFHVGEMQDPHRAAIYCHARNLHVGGIIVWAHPRLPQDAAEREIVLVEAKNILMRRLLTAGVL